MRRSYVMKTLFLGLVLMISLFSFDMEAQAKCFDESPSVNVEAIHERDVGGFRNDSLSDGNLIDDDMNSNSNKGRKEWSASEESFSEVPVTLQKISIDENNDLDKSSEKEMDVRAKEEQEEISDDFVPNLFGEDNRQIDSEKIWSYVEWVKLPFLDLQERNDLARSSIKNIFAQQLMDISMNWTTSLRDKMRDALKESSKLIFNQEENRLRAGKRTNEKNDDKDHQNEDRWFIFDAKNHDESKEKESKKKKVKQEQTRNGKDLERRNKVYVNALIRVRMELVYFACEEEREWIVRRETLF